MKTRIRKKQIKNFVRFLLFRVWAVRSKLQLFFVKHAEKPKVRSERRARTETKTNFVKSFPWFPCVMGQQHSILENNDLCGVVFLDLDWITIQSLAFVSKELRVLSKKFQKSKKFVQSSFASSINDFTTFISRKLIFFFFALLFCSFCFVFFLFHLFFSFASWVNEFRTFISRKFFFFFSFCRGLFIFHLSFVFFFFRFFSSLSFSIFLVQDTLVFYLIFCFLCFFCGYFFVFFLVFFNYFFSFSFLCFFLFLTSFLLLFFSKRSSSHFWVQELGRWRTQTCSC